MTRISTTLREKFADNFYDKIVEDIVNDQEGKEKSEILALKKKEDGTYDII